MASDFQALWGHWGRTILAHIPQIIQALLIATLALYFAGRLQLMVERMVGVGHRRRELGRLLGRLTRIGVILAGLLLVLGVFDQTQLLASFIASLGIFGLLIAFALQDITKNFAAGVLILVQQPFSLDDRIRVGIYEGVVTDVSLRATVLRTADGIEVLIPNAEVYSGAITNLTRYPLRRHAVVVTFPIDVEAEAARRALEEALRGVGRVELEPRPYVAATVVAKDDYQLEARFWIRSSEPEAPAIISAVTLAMQQAAQTLRMQQAAPTAQ